jgi:hypothetical protein
LALVVLALAVLAADVVVAATHKQSHKATHTASPATTTTPSTAPATTESTAPPSTAPPPTSTRTTAKAGTTPTTTGSGGSGLTTRGAGQVAGGRPDVGATGGPNLLGPGLALLALATVLRRHLRRPAL